jgi:hypothetical protein
VKVVPKVNIHDYSSSKKSVRSRDFSIDKENRELEFQSTVIDEYELKIKRSNSQVEELTK